MFFNSVNPNAVWLDYVLLILVVLMLIHYLTVVVSQDLKNLYDTVIGDGYMTGESGDTHLGNKIN